MLKQQTQPFFEEWIVFQFTRDKFHCTIFDRNEEKDSIVAERLMDVPCFINSFCKDADFLICNLTQNQNHNLKDPVIDGLYTRKDWLGNRSSCGKYRNSAGTDSQGEMLEDSSSASGGAQVEWESSLDPLGDTHGADAHLVGTVLSRGTPAQSIAVIQSPQRQSLIPPKRHRAKSTWFEISTWRSRTFVSEQRRTVKWRS